MIANEDSTIEPDAEPDSAAPDEPVGSDPETPITLPRADPPFGRIEPVSVAAQRSERSSAPDDAPRLTLLAWPRGPEPSEAPPETKPSRRPAGDPMRVAAAVAVFGFVAVSLFTGYDHLRQHALVATAAQENQEIVKSFAALKTRIDAIESARSQEQTAELHKTLAEIKQAVSTAQGANNAMTQLAQRVDKVDKDQSARLDRLEKEQSGRLDKLGEKLEQTGSNRYAEIVARLEKLEKKPATVAIAQPAPSPKAAVPPPAVSNETTGSIDKPKPLLRGYTLEDVRGNTAIIASRDGPFTVSPGDVVPGAGRVLRIERHGSIWVVVTTQGVIASPDEGF